MTCVYMFMMMRSTISEFDKRTVKTYDDAMRAYRMPAPHPEMEGVKYGEELMVFNPEEEDDDDEDDGDIIVTCPLDIIKERTYNTPVNRYKYDSHH